MRGVAASGGAVDAAGEVVGALVGAVRGTVGRTAPRLHDTRSRAPRQDGAHHPRAEQAMTSWYLGEVAQTVSQGDHVTARAAVHRAYTVGLTLPP